jgi:hypothetical protein
MIGKDAMKKIDPNFGIGELTVAQEGDARVRRLGGCSPATRMLCAGRWGTCRLCGGLGRRQVRINRAGQVRAAHRP